MEAALNTMAEHWSGAAANYSNIIREEYENEAGRIWKSLINTYRPAGDNLKVLDCGCGPGFFSILMSREGHRVEAIDISEGMLDVARNNVKELGNPDKVSFSIMDVNKTTFADNTFDLIITRNVTWMSLNLEETYREWLRILKPGGRFIVFDANWHRFEFVPEVAAEHWKCIKEAEKFGVITEEQKKGSDEEKKAIPLENIPLAPVKRPEYDITVLERLKPSRVIVESRLPENIWEGVYRVLYRYLPSFMVCVEK